MVLYANKFFTNIYYPGSSPPYLSVNLGTLGFLSQFTKSQFDNALKETFLGFNKESESETENMKILSVPKIQVEVFSNGFLFYFLKKRKITMFRICNK